MYLCIYYSLNCQSEFSLVMNAINLSKFTSNPQAYRYSEQYFTQRWDHLRRPRLDPILQAKQLLFLEHIWEKMKKQASCTCFAWHSAFMLIYTINLVHWQTKTFLGHQAQKCLRIQSKMDEKIEIFLIFNYRN